MRLFDWYWIARAVGWENLPRRVLHSVRGRLGFQRGGGSRGELEKGALQRQFIATYSEDDALSHWNKRAEKFLISRKRRAETRDALQNVVDPELWRRQVQSDVHAARKGQLRFFAKHVVDAGLPVEFNTDPIHHVTWPVGVGAGNYRQFDPNRADMKCVWEASRFAIAFSLGRQHVYSGSSLEPRCFWELFREWDEQNPFRLSPQWVCGQEATFRLMAWLFASIAMLGESEGTSAEYHRLTELVLYSGKLIEGNIAYARGQKNNHAISEAAGLWTIGILFPELRRSERWKNEGKDTLDHEMRRQVYDDGSYVQHSLNYHRLMMDVILWAHRLGELAGESLSCIDSRLETATSWLLSMIDPSTGRVPNYGANDGALVLPLSCCDYLDFRPVAQAAHYALYRKRCFEPGPWDEKMVWLQGPDSLAAPVERFTRPTHFAAADGGYYAMAGPNSRGLTRIHSFRDRPGHADMLHFDLWYKGQNVLRDGGSYKYFAAEPWQHYFESTAAHNTVQVDGCDQMVKGPRFLWFRWTRSRMLRFEQSPEQRLSYLEGEHYGYRRLGGGVVHRRGILRIDDDYIVVDSVLGEGQHDLAIRWRLFPESWSHTPAGWQAELCSSTFSICVQVPDGMNTILADGRTEPTPEGWESLYYAKKTPTPTLVAAGRVCIPMRLVTIVGPRGETLQVSSEDLHDPGAQLLVTGLEDPELAAAIRVATEGALACSVG